MSTADLAIIGLTVLNLAQVAERAHLLHRLAERIRVAAPPRQAQAPADDGTVRDITRKAS